MFEVGKKVIAIRDHSQKLFKKGDVFDLIGIRKSLCKCKSFLLNINIIGDTSPHECKKCNTLFDTTDKYHWFSSTLFIS